MIALAGAVLLLVASGAGTRASSSCNADATRVLVHSFVRDYSAGRVAVINRMWAPEPRFRWFSSGKPGARFGPPAYVRSTLARYFRSRVRVHERLRLRELRVLYDPRRRVVDFNGKLVRSADDIRPRRPPHDFKGAADCVAGRPMLIVWSM